MRATLPLLPAIPPSHCVMLIVLQTAVASLCEDPKRPTSARMHDPV